MLTVIITAALTAAAPAASPAATIAPAPPMASMTPAMPTPAALALPPVDPIRLALARTSANALFRDGTMARMLDQMLSTGPNGYASAFLDMTLADMMSMMPAQGKAAPDTPEMHMTFRQMIAAKDPYFDQRFAAIHDAVVAEATRLGPKFEGPMRDGLANAMARRFTADQLAEMNRFFATSAGQTFGDQLYSMWMDPAVLKSMIRAMPALAADLPAAAQRIKAANDRFPQPKGQEKKETPAPAAKKATPHRKK